MTVTVLIYSLIDSYSGTFDGLTYDAGDTVHVMFDTDTFALSVDLYDSDDVLKGSPNSGPALTPFRSFELLTEQPFYRFCNSTTLKYINDRPDVWPYAELLSTANHYLCVVDAPVCDLQISSVVDIVKASSPTTNDGSITVNGTSSGGTIKFNLNSDFDYDTEGQTSGLFSTLYPGIYTIYARDENGCFDTFSVRVPVTDVYSVRYRLEFDDSNNYAVHKVDILERGFTDSLTEICAAGDPFKLTYNGFGEGKYSPLIGSSAVIGLISETSQQFSDLFLGDERQFQVRYYRDDELRWVGYIIPSLYEEPYIATPYPIYLTATDGIGDLKTFDFLNDVNERYRGNTSQLFIIKEILNKLNLDINIHSGLNIYEDNMDQAASDDPLPQSYVDTDVYYGPKPEEEPFDCDAVLQAILKPYGARLFQSYGKWWIVRTSEMNAAFDYRVFDSDGVYQSNSIYNPLTDFSSATDINRAVPRDKAGLLMILPGYGKIIVTQEKGLKNNLIKSGEFEEDDLVPIGNGSETFFKDWAVELRSAGITYGLESVINGESRGALYMDFLSASDNDYSIVKSALFEIETDPTDKMKLSFQYLVRPSIQALWVRFGFKIIATGGATTFYYSTNPIYNTPTTSPWITTDTLNEIYADKFGEFVKLEFSSKAEVDATHLEFRFYLQANNRVDYSSIGSLPTITASVPFGTKRTVGRTIDTEDHVSYYTATDTNEPDDSPNLIVSGSGAWKLDKTIRFSQDFSILNSILIDNLKIEYLPDGQDPDNEKVFTFINSEFIKTKFEEDVIHGDLEDSNNAKNIYKNYLRFSDGTPTALWSSAVSPNKPLIQILIEDYAVQMTVPNQKIQSPIFYDVDLTFLTTFEDQFDGGRQYLPVSLEMDVKNNTSNIEMIELKQVSMYEISGGVTDLIEEVDGDINYIPASEIFSVDGAITDLIESVTGTMETIAEISLDNTSLDISISDVQVDTIDADITSGSLPNTTGNNTQFTTEKTGIYDVDLAWSASIAGQHIELTDSDGNEFCENIGTGSGTVTFVGVSIRPETAVQIEAADGTCS